MDAALSFLTARMRTVREVEEKLDELQYGEADVFSTVERLKELNLLNDEAYAREFVRSRLATKPVSRQKLYLDLRAHRVPEE
jgi:regulatory protein